MPDRLLLYHWSPTRRRWPIRHDGIRPGSLSTDRLWRPPYTCWSDSPSFAWGSSGMMPRGALVSSWDLWVVWADRLDRTHLFLHSGDPGQAEWRYRAPIPPADVWLVGTRTAEHDEEST